MTASKLEAYLYHHIPISGAMGVKVVWVTSEEIRLSAPLAPNINHCHTVFGGSESTLAILAAWSLIQVSLKASFPDAQLVIRRNSVEYTAPITGDFTATALAPSDAQWELFLRAMKRKNMGRVTINAFVRQGNEVCGEFLGEFVATRGAIIGR